MKPRKLAKSEFLKIRLSIYELEKLKEHAWKHKITVSELIRNYVKRLPAIKLNFDEFCEYYYQIKGDPIDLTIFNIPMSKAITLTLEEWLKSYEFAKREESKQNSITLDEWSKLAGWQ